MEKQNPASVSLGAKIFVSPVLSHSVLTIILFISILPLCAGILFLWYDKDHSWILFLISFLLIIIVCVGWWRSQKFIDLGSSNPTIISDKHGNHIVTDARTLESENSVAQLGFLLQSIGMRNPLPEPNGLVDNKGDTLPDTQHKAIELVNNINNNLREKNQNFINEATRAPVKAVQDTMKLPEESYKNVLEHNQTTQTDKI